MKRLWKRWLTVLMVPFLAVILTACPEAEEAVEPETPAIEGEALEGEGLEGEGLEGEGLEGEGLEGEGVGD